MLFRSRGSIYTELGRGILQTNFPVSDNTEVVIYKGEDGKLWARPVDEFEDGRFEKIKR